MGPQTPAQTGNRWGPALRPGVWGLHLSSVMCPQGLHLLLAGSGPNTWLSLTVAGSLPLAFESGVLPLVLRTGHCAPLLTPPSNLEPCTLASPGVGVCFAPCLWSLGPCSLAWLPKSPQCGLGDSHWHPAQQLPRTPISRLYPVTARALPITTWARGPTSCSDWQLP